MLQTCIDVYRNTASVMACCLGSPVGGKVLDSQVRLVTLRQASGRRCRRSGRQSVVLAFSSSAYAVRAGDPAIALEESIVKQRRSEMTEGREAS